MVKNGKANGKQVEDKEIIKNKEAAEELIKLLDATAGVDVETKSWVSTGIKSLNFLLSGDVDKGIPAGKMVVVAGEQQSGKSLMGARIAAHAQKQGYVVVWLDSEHAADKSFLARQGLDVTRIAHKHVDTVEELQNTTVKALKKAKEKGWKLFIVLDSLGALSGEKEMADAEAEKLTSDMGQRAKNLRSVLKQIIHRISATDSCFYCINHIMISPGFIPKKDMSGGFAPWFLAQIVLFLTKLKGEDGIFTRVRIKAKKNREFIEGRMVEFDINYRTGIDPNEGTIDLLEEFEIIKKKGGWYTIEGDEKSYRPETITKDEALFAKLLDQLKEKTKDYNYSSFTTN
jgi:RecA/RadA recombinase